MSKKSQRTNAVMFFVATTLASVLSVGYGQSTESKSESLAAWKEIATVLQHPRCRNCHQREAPLQGEVSGTHIPRVERGTDNRGISAMRCGDCHNQMGNNETSGIPGARHWSLAPASMVWHDLSLGEQCEHLKNPAHNGNRSPEDLIHHMRNDPLVLWAWNPGAGRKPVPIPHDRFIELLTIWVEGGAPCPNS